MLAVPFQRSERELGDRHSRDPLAELLRRQLGVQHFVFGLRHGIPLSSTALQATGRSLLQPRAPRNVDSAPPLPGWTSCAGGRREWRMPDEKEIYNADREARLYFDDVQVE